MSTLERVDVGQIVDKKTISELGGKGDDLIGVISYHDQNSGKPKLMQALLATPEELLYQIGDTVTVTWTSKPVGKGMHTEGKLDNLSRKFSE